MKRSGFFALLISLLTTAYAHAGYSLGGSGSGPFAKLTEWMQDFIDFMDGPMGIGIVVISLILGVVVWIWAPKSGAVGVLVRVVIGAIVILNVGTWMASFVS